MRFLYQYPEAVGPSGRMTDAGDVAEVARAVEAAGLDGLAFTEHPAPSAKWLAAGGHQTLDPFVALGAAAAGSRSIRLVTYLSVAAYRNPFLLGKAAATVDIVSGGRFVLGLGTGYQKAEFRALGVDFERRNEAFDEVLEILPRYWNGEVITMTGLDFEARDVVGLPGPLQNPIPIWVGGNSRLAARRAVRVQGWMPMLTAEVVSNTTRTAHIGDVETLASRIRETRDLAGDRADSIDVLVTCPDHSIAEPGVDVERHRDFLGRLAEAGVTWVGVQGHTTSLDSTIESIEHVATSYR